MGSGFFFPFAVSNFCCRYLEPPSWLNLLITVLLQIQNWFQTKQESRISEETSFDEDISEETSLDEAKNVIPDFLNQSKATENRNIPEGALSLTVYSAFRFFCRAKSMLVFEIHQVELPNCIMSF